MKMIELDAEGMAAFLSGGRPQKKTPTSKILPEALLARLNAAKDLMIGDCPFAPGDIVKVRDDAPIRALGPFYVVVEVDKNAPKNDNEPGVFNSRMVDDVYAITMNGNEEIVGFWMAHYHLEHFDPLAAASQG